MLAKAIERLLDIGATSFDHEEDCASWNCNCGEPFALSMGVIEYSLNFNKISLLGQSSSFLASQFQVFKALWLKKIARGFLFNS